MLRFQLHEELLQLMQLNVYSYNALGDVSTPVISLRARAWSCWPEGSPLGTSGTSSVCGQLKYSQLVLWRSSPAWVARKVTRRAAESSCTQDALPYPYAVR